MSVTINELTKVVSRLKSAIQQDKNEFIRDSVIQRFKFCVELSWKNARKIMGTSTTAPKQVIREMAQNGLIEDVQLWLRAIDERNLSSHTYNEELAEKVYDFVLSFFDEFERLLEQLDNS